MEISASAVKDLREKTGAGIMDCKKALAQTQGDIEAAVIYLREKGLAAAQKKASRLASEGIVSSYIHGGKVGVLLEVNCETDFVAKTDGFATLVREIAMHVAAMNPQFVSRSEVPAEVIENVAKLGENISVRRFARFKVGEGLEKKESDFAAEVAAAQK